MRVNIEWLSEWTDVSAGPEAVAAALTTSGLEVDEVVPVSAQLDGIVVAAVRKVERHPNADRLSVCEVDDGDELHQVVCGAPNVRADIKVPFARVGARLPDGSQIKAAELRGVRSQGMLCSAKELELSDDAAGLLLLDDDAAVGITLREHLRLDDSALEVNVTPNRGDCFSVVGLAREIGARLGNDFRRPVTRPTPPTIDETLPVTLSAQAQCPRFAGRVVRGIATNRTSPLWLRERLRRAGLRAIHPVVDVTNYVMLELGQPLHAYDLDKLTTGIDVRLARTGEQLVLLDGKELTLDDEVLVIADGRGPVGLAGIMGGQSTAVGTASADIFFEAAHFAPRAIAGRARRFGLHTDASMRFERGVDPTQQVRAIERATELLLQISGGQAGPVVVTEDATHVPNRAPITLRRERLEALLGMALGDTQIESALERLEMTVDRGPGHWRVTPPAFRFDLAIEEDLVEEVGRMIGYDHIPITPGNATEQLGTATEKVVDPDRALDVLVARGFAEVITYSFIDPELEEAVNPGATQVPLANPIASDMAVLRRSLWPGLIVAARRNLAHQRARFKLMELGPQFTAEAGRVTETAVLAGIAVGERFPEHWDGTAPEIDFFDVKGDLEALFDITGRASEYRFEAATHPALSPGRTARILRGTLPIGWLGALHPTIQERLDRKRAAVVFALQLDHALSASIPSFEPYSKFPFIRRDLAVVVDEQTSADTVTATVRAAAGPLLKRLVIFDVYRGPGVDSRRKSIGLGLILQDTSRTLTDADADKIVQSATLRLERELGATIRT